MSRKDFVLIAETIQKLPLDWVAKPLVAEAFADALAATNSGFDRGRFIEAATVGKKTVAK